MSETRTSHPGTEQAAAERIAELEAALAATEPVKTETDQAVGQELDAADELIDAQAERIRLLEEELAAREVVPADSYDLDEVFVAEGRGTCLECSCEEYRLNPREGGSACWLCNHDRGLHKRNPRGCAGPAVTAYRLDHAVGRSNVGVPVASALTIAPDGRVYDGPVSTEPVASGERPLMVWHDNVVDEALAAFLVHCGQGHRLRPMSEADLASPRTEAMRVATPQYIRHWYAAEVAAGRIVPPKELPPVAVRKALREAQGLARPAVAAQLGVSVDAIRLWELGAREPEGENMARYHDLLTSWQSGPQEPAEKRAEPEPERQPSRGPLTNASHKESLAAAVRAHQARMRTVHGRRG